MKKLFLFGLTALACSCLYNHTIDQMTFENVAHVDSLMTRQLILLEKIPVLKAGKVISWKIREGKFILNNINLDSISSQKNDSLLSSWKLSQQDYKDLQNIANQLYLVGICNAYEAGNNKTFAFSYKCDARGFDVKERFIFLKKRFRDKQLLINTTVLDENERMILCQ